MTNKTMSDEQQELRDKFEAWATSQHMHLERSEVHGYYEDMNTYMAWKGYKAALSAQAQHTPDAAPAQFKDAVFQASIDFIGELTGMRPPDIEVAPPEVFAPFRAFTERVVALAAPTAAVQQDRESALDEVAMPPAHLGYLEAAAWRQGRDATLRALKLKDAQPAPEVPNLHETMDAKVWTDEFCRINPAADWGAMIGWFANAIMCGYDHAKRTAAPASEAALTNRSVLQKAYLYTIGDGPTYEFTEEGLLDLARAILQTAQPVQKQCDHFYTASGQSDAHNYYECEKCGDIRNHPRVAPPQGELPELPKHHGYVGEEAVYYASDMRDYARAALAGQQEGTGGQQP